MLKTRALVTAALVAGSLFLVSTADARSRIRDHDRQPLRSVVREVRGESPAFSTASARIHTASFGTSKGMIKSYDPWNQILKRPEDLEELIAQANSGGFPLFVYLCGHRVAVREDPELLAIVEDPQRFEELPARDAFVGLEELFSYRVYRYLGAR